VRDADSAATLEVEPEQMPRLREPERLARIERRLLDLGYTSVAVDQNGYRRGNLNRALPV
jgi:PP-loop superfamily ATP-utilizing enzyme